MTDHITRIREALEAGPTPGPWTADVPDGYWAREARIRAPQWGCIATLGIDLSSPHWDGPQRANAALIAACNPVAIRSLLAALDEAQKDAERYRWLRSRVPGGDYRIAGVIYSEGGAGVDAAIDAAIAAQEGGK